MRLASCSELASTVTVYRPRSVTSDAFAAALVGNDVMIDGLAVVHAEPEHRTRKDRKNRYALLRFEGGSLFSTHPTLAQKVLSLEKNEICTRRCKSRPVSGGVVLSRGGVKACHWLG